MAMSAPVDVRERRRVVYAGESLEPILKHHYPRAELLAPYAETLVPFNFPWDIPEEKAPDLVFVCCPEVEATGAAFGNLMKVLHVARWYKRTVVVTHVGGPRWAARLCHALGLPLDPRAEEAVFEESSDDGVYEVTVPSVNEDESAVETFKKAYKEERVWRFPQKSSQSYCPMRNRHFSIVHPQNIDLYQ